MDNKEAKPKYIIESDYIYNGFRCICIAQQMGHRCGYIGIPKGHKFYGINYNEFPDDFEVHGGWTYSDNVFLIPSKDIWWIGFDCAHYWDAPDEKIMREFMDIKQLTMMLEFSYRDEYATVKTQEFVEQELQTAVAQLLCMEEK